MASEEPLHILLFGDQTGDYVKILSQLLHIKENTVLTSFFEKAYYALRDEVSQQPRAVRDQISGFSSIADLVARYSESTAARSNPLESALTCISHIACFICHQASLSEGYPAASDTRIIGSCTGLLAAAAVSSSQDTVELLPAAIEAVKIGFRIGILVSEIRNQIEQGGESNPSWSAVVPGIRESDATGILDKFHSERCIPASSRAYISASSPSALTISGPHLILDQLFQSAELSHVKPTRLSIYGPFHAAHLYNEGMLQKLLLPRSDILESQNPRIPVLSTATGDWITASTLGQMLEFVLQDILVRPLHWEKVLENAASAIKETGGGKCTILRLGPSNAGQSLVSALTQNQDLVISLDDRFIGDMKDLGPDESSGRSAHSKIAICGLSGRFPDAANHEAFWELLAKGLDLHREIPNDRFDVGTHVDADGKRNNTSHTPFGCFIENPGLFDPRFFGISPREAAQTDPMQRLALVTAYEALEMSGYVPNRTPSTKLDRIGTFYGQTSDDWREIQAAQKVDTYFIPGGVRAFGPGRINYHFKFSGPSFNIDTACSSSLAAIQLACTSLWANDCDTAVAGGMNVLTNPDIFSGLSRGQFLSKTGSCQTFDDDADGYCRADGVGTVILKRLEDAEADKDPIFAVILGSATNHSAEAVSITHPHAGAQEFLYKKVLNAAGVDAHDVSYVEMHGTGTQAGDATEMRSVTNTFAPENRRRRPDQKLHLGAVKANAGHGEAASGITSLIKVLTMLDKNLIPPHCGIKGNINRTFPKDLEERNVHIPFQLTPWVRPEGKSRLVFLNNFSAAGGNTALLLEDAPPAVALDGTDLRSNHIVAVSAKSRFSLRENIESLIAILDDPGMDLSSLSYTTTARRIQHNYRVTVAGPDISKVKEALSSSIDQDVSQILAVKPKVAFVFTGQGSQYAAMGKQLFETSPQFQTCIKHYDAISVSQGFPSFQPLIDGSVSDIQTLGPMVVQLGAVCVQISLFELLSSWGIRPTVVVGHSLGEYAALCAAGVLSISDTISIVGQRAKLLEEKCHAGTHCMLAVKGSVASIGHLLDGQVFEIACINAPEDTVVSGTNINIDLLSEELKERGFKSTKLAVPFAFHSAQVEPILDDLEALAKGITFQAPTVPVISPLMNEVITDEKAIDPYYLRRHCRETVNFLGGMEAAKHSGVVGEGTLWVEIGCHPICSNMIKSTFGPVKSVPTLRRNEDNWKVITSSLCTLHSAGLDIDWNEYHRDFELSHKLIRLPTYRWDNKNYWIDYKNDWCLTKGNSNGVAEIPSIQSKLSNASVHRIVEENFNDDDASIIVESDLAEPGLKEVIKGHEVNGFGLCPPSLYAEMALTTAEYIYKQRDPDVDRVDMNVCNMKVEKPLIADDKDHQLLHISGNVNWATMKVDFSYYSINGEGKKTVTHATCAVKYESRKAWLAGWERSQYMVRSRVESLVSGVNNGNNHQIKRAMAYKLFGGLIHYGPKYQGMEEVILNDAELEATSTVAFAPGATDSDFYISPYVIDSVAHLSGFVMLANEAADPSKNVHVSHGWETCRFARPFSKDKKYRAYVKMQEASAKVVVGDVYVFEEDTVIAVVEGLEFHLLPRQLMDSILSSTGGKSKSASPLEPSPISKAKPNIKNNSPAKPKSTPKASVPRPASAATSSSSLTDQALKICAEEIGIPASELSDTSSFAEMGVDSLLSLTVSGKFRENLDIEVPSSLFVDFPTVKDLKQFLTQFSSEEIDQEISPDAEGSSFTEVASGTTTPTLETDSHSSVVSEEETLDPKTSDGKMATMIRSTVAEELGVPITEIDASTDLVQLGVDSLMSLTVLGKLRETTGTDLPSDFFTEHTTFGDIEKSFNVTPDPSPTPKPRERDSNKSSTRPTVESKGESKHDKKSPPATSILMQGDPKTTSRKLFLFPDGSGSATSYAQIPAIDDDLAVYGLICPFIKCPEDYVVGIPAVSALYLAEVRRRQPRGPYIFGGWSAGGVCAYETALQVQAQGEMVDRLILLDAPCPIRLDPLPSRLHNFFDSIGLLGPEGHPNGPPDWLLPHFDKSIVNLSAYKPEAMDPANAPKTYAIWARDGVCKYPEDPRPEPEHGDEEPSSMKWLLDDRTDLNYNGWDQVIPAESFAGLESVAEANHFTIMRKPATSEVRDFIRRALE